MNDKIFELQQDLISLQDSFKDAIMSEPDAEKHADIVAKFSKEEDNLSKRMEKEIEKLEKQEEKQEEKLEDVKVETIKEEVKSKQTPTQISKMTEAELIIYGKAIGADVDSKYSKAKNLANVRAKQ